jgi:transposase InsO family protein
MSRVEPVDPRVRLAIVQWPPDAPRGAVTTFCLEHNISRETFYAIRKRALIDGPAAALEPRSRRPRRSPAQLTDDVVEQAVGVRAALERSGLDHGPISVHEKMRSLGMDPVPSTASLSRIFRDQGVAKVEPRKKPRASYRRFVYPAPNACWQLDATEYVLTGGRKCVIFQLIDDHSRLAIASHVTWGETSVGAIAVVSKGIAAHGVPQRLLSDNGAALNPSRRGVLGQLVSYVTSLGVEAITGKPYKPTTQGKNERFHQTLFRFLDKQPLASTLEELQRRSMRSTPSTTPSGRTRACPGGSLRNRPGRRPQSSHHHGRPHARRSCSPRTGSASPAFATPAPSSSAPSGSRSVAPWPARSPTSSRPNTPSKSSTNAARCSSNTTGRHPEPNTSAPENDPADAPPSEMSPMS